ncbi:unnamed protein product [Polarella glacialis]|uniref:Uncharacterized protein n=1 Tax=Polarella glacialis TaxID=89957 RepID=A0A813L393_POLGL|nr:unnamed protein product [Polarella glacialis]
MDHLAPGSPVKIFRTKCDSWIPGRISDTKTDSDWVTVEFTEDDLLCRKKLHMASISLQRMDSSTLPGRRQSRHEEEECDPKFNFSPDPSRTFRASVESIESWQDQRQRLSFNGRGPPEGPKFGFRPKPREATSESRRSTVTKFQEDDDDERDPDFGFDFKPRTSLKIRHIPGADMQKRNDILRDQQCSLSIPPPLEMADQIRDLIGRRWKVCILGSAEFKNPDAESIVRHLATGLCSHLGRRLAFITGGMPGVQATFAKQCSRDASIWNILPKGVQSHCGVGKDVVAAADAAAKKVVFANVGDIYITIEGGPGVAEESRIAHQRGALIIPMIRTGGASSGMFDFPAAALTKPSWASESLWNLLSDTNASPEASAIAVRMLIAHAFPH